MSKKKIIPSLKANFSWTLFGNVLYSSSQFGILIVLAKIGSPEIVGQFTLALALSSPIFLFFNFKLRAVQATDQSNQYTFNEYYNLRLITSVIVIVILIIIMSLTNYSTEVKIIIMGVGIAKFFDALSDIVHGLIQKNEAMHIIAKSIILKGMLSLFLIAVSYYLTRELVISIGLMAISSLIIYYFFDVPQSKRYGAKYKVNLYLNSRLMKLLILSLPLGITVVLGSLNTNIPRYFIEHYNGQYELGIFAGISFLLVACGTLINALGQVVTPRLANYYQFQKFKLFYQLLYKSIIIGFFIGILGLIIVYFLGEQILTVVYTKEYANYNNVFMIIMIGAIFLYTTVFFGTGLTAMRKFKLQLPIHVFSFCVVLLTSVIFIPKYGVTGGAFVILFGNLASSIGYFSTFIYIKYTENGGKRDVNKISEVN